MAQRVLPRRHVSAALIVFVALVASCAGSAETEISGAADISEATILEPTAVPTTPPVTVTAEPTASAPVASVPDDSSVDAGTADDAPSPTTVVADDDGSATADAGGAADAAGDGAPAAAASEGAATDSGTEDADVVGDSTVTPVPVANADYLGDYQLVDDQFGTMVTVSVDGGTRTISSNALPNHAVGAFPNAANPNSISAQNRSWSFTTSPTFTGVAQPVRETGVALNGVKFEPGTAEVVQCSTGEQYRIEGIQDTFSVGLDVNLAHVQPTGEYHYHGVSPMLVDAFDTEADLVLVGFAADGHLIYYSKSGAFQPSYVLSTTSRTGSGCQYRGQQVDIAGSAPDGIYVSDWSYVPGLGSLDECNGTTIDGQYAYLITEAYPYVPRCLMGSFTGAGPGGGGGGGGGQPPQGQDGPAQPPQGEAPQGEAPQGEAPPEGAGGQPPQDQGGQAGGPPDLTDAAAALGVTTQQLQDLLGGPPPDFAAAATALGLSLDDFLAVMAANGAAPAG